MLQGLRACVCAALLLVVTGSRSRDEIVCSCFKYPHVDDFAKDAPAVLAQYNEWAETNNIDQIELANINDPAKCVEKTTLQPPFAWVANCAASKFEVDDHGECKAVCGGCQCAGYDFDEGDACFPGTATVELKNGTVVPMARLEVGHQVLVAGGQYSEVLLFSHRNASKRSPFVAVTVAAAGRVLRLSPGHYLYVNGKLRTARTVAVGDVVTVNGGPARVTAVAVEAGVGLYNPHTAAGDIVVDGVLASTLTDAVAPAVANALLWSAKMLKAAGAPVPQFADGAVGFTSGLRSLGLNGAQRYEA